jgi:tRNA(Arg) A34 adenosine deaminase TadA
VVGFARDAKGGTTATTAGRHQPGHSLTGGAAVTGRHERASVNLARHREIANLDCVATSQSADSEIVDRAQSVLEQHAPSVVPGTRREYVLILLSNALVALRRGDYAIGAVAAVRHEDIEILSLGANSMFSQSDPRGHAEANALGVLLALGRSTPADGAPRLGQWSGVASLRDVASGVYIRRTISFEDTDSSILYTSLEPCPMCTVVTLNSGVKRVWVAGRDPTAGALSKRGVHDMPPTWSKIQKAQGTVVEYSDARGTDGVVQELATLVGELFRATKEPLDHELSRGGLLKGRRFARALEDLDSFTS